jgi:hypothetical protein
VLFKGWIEYILFSDFILIIAAWIEDRDGKYDKAEIRSFYQFIITLISILSIRKMKERSILNKTENLQIIYLSLNIEFYIIRA